MIIYIHRYNIYCIIIYLNFRSEMKDLKKLRKENEDLTKILLILDEDKNGLITESDLKALKDKKINKKDFIEKVGQKHNNNNNNNNNTDINYASYDETANEIKKDLIVPGFKAYVSKSQ